MIGPKLEELAKEYSDVHILKVYARVSRISMIHILNNEILELVSVHDDAKMTKVRILVAELITYFSYNNLRHAYMDPVTIPMCGFYKKLMMPQNGKQ